MMFPNNNKAIIKKLSRRSLKMNRTRNLFAVLAIILTTVLLTAGFTAGTSLVKSATNYLEMGKGVDSHGNFDVTLDQYEKLKQLTDVKQAGLLRDCSTTYIQSEEVVGNKVYLKYGDEEMFKMNFVIPIEGDYPKRADEILMPTFVLDLFDLSYEVGRQITLSVSVIENGEAVIKPFDFILCGYFDPVVPSSSNYAEIFTGEDFIKQYNAQIPKDHNRAYVKLNTLTSKSTNDEGWEEMNKIANSLGIKVVGLDPDFVDPFLLRKVEIADIFALAIPSIIAILLIMFSGYLLIYNIFYISVVHDIRYYGLLKTIGTTPKQIKSMINKQALMLSLIGIPIGLVLGYMIGVVFTPFLMTQTVLAKYVKISAHPIIFIFSIIFSYMTVHLSCRKPGEIAGKISPVEAVRYSGVEKYHKKLKKSKRGGKLHRMALTNIFRNRGKAITVIASITLSAVIFVFAFNGSVGLNPVKDAEEGMQADFELMHYNAKWWQKEEYKPISIDTYNQLKKLPFVTQINKYYMARSDNDKDIIDGGFTFLLTSAFRGEVKNNGLLKEEFESYRDAGMPNWKGRFITPSGNIKTRITGIETNSIEKEVSYDKIIDGRVEKEKFSTGEYLIFCRDANRVSQRRYGDGIIKTGDKMELSFYVPYRDEYVTREFTVMAVVEDTNWKGQTEIITIPDTVFEEIYGNYNELISQIMLDVDIDLKIANDKIQSIINKSGNFQIYFTSKYEVIKGNERMKSGVMIIGLTISLIIGIIGFLNMANTMMTSIISRRRELAMLESMGMTKKQLKRMLTYEGMYYTIISTMLIVPLGFLSSLSSSLIPFFGGFSMAAFILSIIIVVVIITIISISIPKLAFSRINTSTIIERLREVE